jgi:hypothetical protein
MMTQLEQPEKHVNIDITTNMQVDRPISATLGSGYKPPGGIG